MKNLLVWAAVRKLIKKATRENDRENLIKMKTEINLADERLRAYILGHEQELRTAKFSLKKAVILAKRAGYPTNEFKLLANKISYMSECFKK